LSEAAAQLPAVVQWHLLPDVLTPAHLKAALGIKRTSTISRLVSIGQLPKPCLSTGNIIRWRKEDVIRRLDERMRMG
jgi:predicted DNA-binding transcriptional regulator AlpA